MRRMPTRKTTTPTPGARSDFNPAQPQREEITTKLASDLDRWLATYKTSDGQPPTEGDVIIAWSKMLTLKLDEKGARKWLLDLTIALLYYKRAR